jgi:hypothetical protein
MYRMGIFPVAVGGKQIILAPEQHLAASVNMTDARAIGSGYRALYARTHAAAHPDRQTVVALVTHGSDTIVCGEDIYISRQVASEFFAATPSIKTAIIALLPCLGPLIELGWAGGSRVYGVNRRSLDARAETLAALHEVAAPCNFPVPATPTPLRMRNALGLEVRLGPAGAFSNSVRVDGAEHAPWRKVDGSPTTTSTPRASRSAHLYADR